MERIKACVRVIQRRVKQFLLRFQLEEIKHKTLLKTLCDIHTQENGSSMTQKLTVKWSAQLETMEKCYMDFA